jgi:phospholipid transport system substrate-binding protein
MRFLGDRRQIAPIIEVELMSVILRLLAAASLPLTLLLLPTQAVRAADTPDALVKSTTEDVLAVIKKTTDRKTLRQLAEQKVLPNFDFKEMTRLAVGRSWRDATPEQQKRLEAGFRSLIVNTYTSALSRTAASERKVEVQPLQPGAHDKEVTVHTLVKGGGAQPLAIDYRMENSPQGWKVFDVVVENVSLVTTYRGSFSEEVQRGGIDGLIKTLDEKNRALAQG